MTDEHTVAIVSFEGALKREIKRMRKELQRDESLHSFCIQIKASGRTHEGDVDLEYGVGADTYSPDVKGDSMHAIVEEFMRRRGWKKRHAPIAISYEKIPSDDTTEERSSDDDIIS